MIYLDYNSSTPVDPKVLEAMLPYFTQHFGNAASRNHPFGWEAEEAVDYAREQVAKLIGADPKEIIFTSGATEGDNLGIKGVYEMYASKGNHIITATTEHKAVLDTCKHIEKTGGEVTYLKVKDNGLIDLAELEAAIKPTTILIAIMYFLMIRPQQKKAKEHQAMLAALAKGDEVVTGGGIAGRVAKIGENYVSVEVSEGVEVQVQKPAIALVLPKGTLKGL